ncbi:TetR family transcriptional regulator [Streptomyces sp. NPDC005496]|uniref:TetR family transcriptional regulator n=1 Tax=unclassified Streptomyces TaxID=2593676 RepID=UPI0033B93AD4
MPMHQNPGPAVAVEAPADPPRVARRENMRERILDAAHELTCAHGWDRASLSAVASRAQVSRPSVYKEFGSRARLGHALVARETRQLLDDVAGALATSDRHPRAALETALLLVLTAAEHHPLLRSVVTAARRGSDSLLAYLTARTDPFLDAVQNVLRTWLAERFPHQGEEHLEEVVDVVVRMTISHLVLPTWPPGVAACRLSRIAVRLLGET